MTELAARPDQQDLRPDLQPPQDQPPKPTRHWWRWLLALLLAAIVSLVLLLGWLMSTNSGSRLLLNWVMARQALITYQYQDGNLLRGLSLTNIHVKVKKTEVLIDRAKVRLGWRAFLQREIHLMTADFGSIEVISHAPPSDEPFKFNELKLPFVLRIDEGQAQALRIRSAKSRVNFYDLHVNDAEWSGYRIQLVDSAMRMDFLQASHITGQIELYKQYPLNLTGQVRIPALQGLNLQQISVAATGDINLLKVGVASATPDVIAGYLLMHPVQKGTPMWGKLSWVDFHAPFAPAQQLFSKAGSIDFRGNAKQLQLQLITDLVGRQVPKGQYQVAATTDFKGLDIHQFNGQLMGGQVNLTGQLNWQNGLHWQISGDTARLNPADPHIPASLRPFLPPVLDGKLQLRGDRQIAANAQQQNIQTTDIRASLDFDRYETWEVSAIQQLPVRVKPVAKQDVIGQTRITTVQSATTQPDQPASPANPSKPATAPWQVQVNWRDINRALPYVGWLNSPQGQVNVMTSTPAPASSNRSDQNRQMTPHRMSLTAQVAATRPVTAATAQTAGKTAMVTASRLPAGDYQATLALMPGRLDIQQFVLRQGTQQLAAQGVVNLPQKQRPLSWNARVQAKQFNPQQLQASIPLTRLNGQFQTSGGQQGKALVIQLRDIQLEGQLAQPNTQMVALTGESSIALISHDKKTGGLQGFAVRYDGQLNAKNYTQGPLRLNVSGTPKRLNIEQLYHRGAAGMIDARGVLDLTQGLAWNIQARLDQFKPHFFVSKVTGELSGQLRSHGQWSATQKQVFVQDLDLKGMLNGKPVLGQGNLAVDFRNKQPQQLRANNLLITYAGNQFRANGTGQRLMVDVDAQHLPEVYPGLHGAIKGQLQVQLQPQLQVQADLLGQNVGFKDVVNVQALRLVGTLPTGQAPTQFVASLSGVQNGNRRLEQAQVLMRGNRQAHIIRLNLANQDARFSTQLAGGLTAQNDWLGQWQEGRLTSRYATIQQQRPATVIYRNAAQHVTILPHCWSNLARGQGEICLSQPLMASKQNGAVSVTVNNVELNDFSALLPQGFAMQGRLNGYSHLVWQNGRPMQMESVLTTQNGKISLAGDEDTDVPPTTLDYRQIRLTANTQPQGLSLRLAANTQQLGNAFADVMVGTQTDNKTLTGTVALNDVGLSVLRPFIRDARVLDGQLSAAGRVGGTLKQPQFDGEVRLRDGRFGLISAPVNLTNIQLSSTIRGTRATLVGGFNAGQGVGQLTGQADWSGVPVIQLKLKGQELLVAQAPTISASVTPQIAVDIRPTLRQLTASGQIDIPRAVILMPQGSANVVAVSPDVRIVRQGVDPYAALKASRPWRIRADIGVTLGDKVVFRGFNSVIPLIGKLNLTQRGTQMALQANGAIGVSRRVKIEAYGQSLDLNRAIARFGGELSNPTLDIEASKSIDNSKVGFRVTGNATRPQINIFNDAGLSEQQALNALLSGHISNNSGSSLTNTEGFKSDINNTIAAAGLSMGLGGTRALTNSIGRSFGLSGLALDAQGTGNDTQVSVTGYITPDLYLRYGVGIFTPVTKLTLRYQVNRRMYLEASSSVERAVDVFYNWRW